MKISYKLTQAGKALRWVMGQESLENVQTVEVMVNCQHLLKTGMHRNLNF
jgi:hypothetical protein